MSDDADLLRRVLQRNQDLGDDEEARSLSAKEREAFESMMRQLDRREFSPKQRAWVQAAAVRLGVLDCAPAANVFSSLPPAEQRAHKQRAASVVLPWERPGYQRALKPPGRT